MTDRVVVKILRSHGQAGVSSKYQTYEIPRDGMTRVLDILDYIYKNVDPTLAYRRHLCNDGQCRACEVRVNGKKSLACLKAIKADDAELTIEPTDEYPVVKDLIVDYGSDLKRGD